MRCEGPGPASHSRVIEHRLQLRLEQRGAEQQRERRARVNDVHGGDASVAEILLRKVERRAVRVSYQLVRRQGLPVRQDRQPRVRLPARRAQIGPEFGVESTRAFRKRIMIAPAPPQKIGRLRALSAPPRPLAPLKILDRIQVVVSQHQVARHRIRPRPAQVHRHRQHRRCAAAEIVGVRQLALVLKGCPRLVAGQNRGGYSFVAVRSQIQVAPVDAHIVAAPHQHRLVPRSHTQHRLPVQLKTRRDHRLVVVVDHQVCRRIQVDAHLVRGAVGRSRREFEVRQRPRQYIEIVRQRRRQKGEAHRYASTAEFVHRSRGQHFQSRLLERRVPLLRPSHYGKQLSIDSRQRIQSVRFPRPLFRWFRIQLVRHGPDAEVGIVRNQRHRGRPHRRGRLSDRRDRCK